MKNIQKKPTTVHQKGGVMGVMGSKTFTDFSLCPECLFLTPLKETATFFFLYIGSD